jgi:NADH-quinone oxidoreductase subunit M
MPDLAFPFLTAAIAAPLGVSWFARGNSRELRLAGAGGCAAAALLLLEVLREVSLASGARLGDPLPGAAGTWLAADSLNSVVMVLYCLIALATLLLAPRRDTSAVSVRWTLWVLSATLLAYAADNTILLVAGWFASAIPFLIGPFTAPENWRPRVALLGSTVALLMGCLLMSDNGAGIAALAGQGAGGTAAFACLILAVILRKGIFPAHAWITDAAEGGPVLPMALLFNGHLGAFLLARVVVPVFPQLAQGTFPLLSDLALFTAIYAAIRAVAEKRPRSLLALLALSQSASILAGLESASAEGVTGALVHWLVVASATTGLFGILRLLEVRFGSELAKEGHLGLAQHTPRLAVFFAVCGLALVGLPGTLGFCSEDLLIHGTLESHPQLGLLLPLSTAINAVTLLRLFNRLFLGRLRTGVSGIADAVPRERWVLAAIVLFVVVGGVFPKAVVTAQAHAAHVVAQGMGRLEAKAGSGE